jgi:hypothetical protein
MSQPTKTKPKRARHVWCVDYQRDDGEFMTRICASKSVANDVLAKLRAKGHSEAMIVDEWRTA